MPPTPIPPPSSADSQDSQDAQDAAAVSLKALRLDQAPVQPRYQVNQDIEYGVPPKYVYDYTYSDSSSDEEDVKQRDPPASAVVSKAPPSSLNLPVRKVLAKLIIANREPNMQIALQDQQTTRACTRAPWPS